MGLIEYFKRGKERRRVEKERSRADKASKALATDKSGINKDFYHRGRNLDHGGTSQGVELDHTRPLSHGWDEQKNLYVWHENKGDYITDDAFIKNKEGLITTWDGGITSEKTPLSLLLDVLEERLVTAKVKKYSIDSILEAETALDNYRLHVIQSRDSLSGEALQANRDMIKKVRSKLNEKKSKHLRTNLEKKYSKAKDKKFSGDSLLELVRALNAFEMHIEESKNTLSQDAYKAAKNRIDVIKEKIRLKKLTIPTAKRVAPKKRTRPIALDNPVRLTRSKGRSL